MRRKFDLVRVVSGLVLCWIPFALIVATAILWWDFVIGDVSTQWSGGEVSNSAPTWTVMIMPIGLSLISVVIATFSAFDGLGPGLRQAYFWSFGLGSMAAVCWIGIMIPNVLYAENPPMPGWLIFSPLVILVGFIPWAIVGRGGSRAEEIEVSDRVRTLPPVGSGSRAWVGRTWSPIVVLACFGIGGLVLVLGIVGLVQGNQDSGVISVVVAVLILLAGATFAWLTVVVDGQGVRVRSAIGIPLKRIPIERIQAADATVLAALSWGGVGYRIGPAGTALITRSGPALHIETDRGNFFVSLDRADEAAIVLGDAIGRMQLND